MKKDLFALCFEDAKKAQPQITNTQVQEIFCKVCKNRECGRAGWASTSWESRISTQVDRLILNPNIVPNAQGTQWEGLSNFEGFVEPNRIEVWGSEWKSKEELMGLSADRISADSKLVLIDSPNPPQSPPKTEPSPPIIYPIDEGKPKTTAPSSSSKAFNTPPPKEIYIGGGVGKSVSTSDPWASPTPTLKVGGTFKMGK